MPVYTTTRRKSPPGTEGHPHRHRTSRPTRTGASGRTRELIRHGDTQGRYQRLTPGDPLDGGWWQACATGLASAGCPESDWTDATSDSATALGRDVAAFARRHGWDEAHRRLASVWRSAQHRVTACPPRRPNGSAADLHTIVEATLSFAGAVLTGRTSGTDLKVMQAWAELATRQGTEEPTCSIRALALGAGVTVNTVMRALRRVTEAGVLVRVEHNGVVRDGGQPVALEANAYRPTSRALRLSRRDDTPPGPPWGAGRVSITRNCRSCPGSDVWRHRDLGASAWLVHNALDPDEGQTPGELAEATGKHPSTVYRALAGLSARGLAVELAPGSWTLGTADPEKSAGETAGRRERDAALYADQRVQRLDKLREWAQARERHRTARRRRHRTAHRSVPLPSGPPPDECVLDTLTGELVAA